jgi:hypothetical protein
MLLDPAQMPRFGSKGRLSCPADASLAFHREWCFIWMTSLTSQLNILDRNNIANTKIAGMTEDLHLKVRFIS